MANAPIKSDHAFSERHRSASRSVSVSAQNTEYKITRGHGNCVKNEPRKEMKSIQVSHLKLWKKSLTAETN
jgi:hypothetical protein